MKPFRSFLALAGSSLLAIPSLHATDGTWNADSAGDWSDTSKWDSSTVAYGADSTATLGNFITNDRIVTLDSDRSIGNITASDTTHNFTISGGSTLTLDLTAGTPTIHVPQSGRTLTISSVIDGGGGMKKTGAGTLLLSTANTYSGGTELASGIIIVGNNNALGPGTVTVSGNSKIHPTYGSYPQISNALQVNAGVTLTTVGSTQYFGMTFTGPVSGGGTIQTEDAGNDANSREKLGLYSDSNTFNGTLVNKGGSAIIRVNSLGDGGKLQLHAGTGGLELGPGAITPLLFATRQVELFGSSVISNTNATASNSITINTALTCGSIGNKTFTIGGSNIGDNTYGGIIGDGNFGAATQVISLNKDGAGKWILTNVNTYTGNTTITDGTLEVRGGGQLGGGTYAGNITGTDATPSPFTFDSSANQTLSGVISGRMALIKDGAGTLSLTNANTYTGSTTVAEGTLSLGNGTNNSSLSDFSTLSVDTGAVLNLNYTGSDTVFLLNLGGSPMAVGQYGHTNSGADNGGAGVGFYDAFFAANTGIINNLGGDTTSIAAAFWDGGTIDIGSNGNASSTDADGTWNTTLQNWDFGFTAHAAWPNTTASRANFNRTANAARTITLGSDITLGGIDLQGTVSTSQPIFFGNTTEDNTLNFGAAGTITTKDYYVGFRCGISGAPTINYVARNGDNSSKLTLAPVGSLTMALGAIKTILSPLVPANCVLELGGTSTGNSASSVTWSNVAQQLGLNKVGAGTWTLSGGWDNGPMGDSQWKVQGGTLILNGNFNVSHRIDVETGGTLGGNATLRVERTGTTEHVRVLAGGTMAPGTSVGTIHVNDKTEIAGTLEIEVNGATADLLAITGDLVLSSATDAIEVVELGAAALTEYTVVTYTGTRTGTFNTETLPAGYTVDYTTPGEIRLIVAGGSSPYNIWTAGYGLQNPWLGIDPALNGEPAGNADGDAFNNILEFGFAFNPTVSDGSRPLTISGGAITQTGPPQIYEDPATHQFFLRYTRRTGFVAAGLTYTAQFASDSLGAGAFEDVTGGSVIATGTGAGGVPIEAVAIEYPNALPGSGKKARFGRVKVTESP